MVDRADKLAGIKDIIEPHAMQMAQQSGWSFVIPVLLLGIVIVYLVYRWKSPLHKARRGYQTILKHQNHWAADVTGEELMAILSLVPQTNNQPDDGINAHYHQAHELCNQLRFAGDLHQPDTVRQALKVTQQILWSGK